MFGDCSKFSPAARRCVSKSTASTKAARLVAVLNARYAITAILLGAGYIGVTLAAGLGWLRAVDQGVSPPLYYGSPCWALNAGQAVSLLLEGQLSLLYAGLLAAFCFFHGKRLAGILVVTLLLLSVGVELVSSNLYRRRYSARGRTVMTQPWHCGTFRCPIPCRAASRFAQHISVFC